MFVQINSMVAIRYVLKPENISHNVHLNLRLNLRYPGSTYRCEIGPLQELKDVAPAFMQAPTFCNSECDPNPEDYVGTLLLVTERTFYGLCTF